ncbi:hypothetical protein ACIBCM_22245 [Streptomyces sp. NPDC051018]|uniref:hypothetical protein n=1 Tax=Streptomyces sp. NPDC051018 TaxID=3365639 RepID=UPI0037A73D77
MPRRGLAQVTHSMASCPVGWLVAGDGWRAVAVSLRRLGCDWPALRELTASASLPPGVEDDVVARIAVQAREEMGDAATLPFWDTVCGLVARSWRLGSGDAIDALYRLDALWFTARDFDASTRGSTSRGLRFIGEGVGLKESIAHVDVTRDAITLLTEADRLIPADVRCAQLCENLLETLE